jgi:hypothetical protein
MIPEEELMPIIFNKKEIEKITIMPGMFGGPDYPAFDYPCSHLENYHQNMRGQGHWVPTSNDIIWFCPKVFPDNTAKGNVHEAVHFPKDRLGGFDMFGIEWTYQADIGGSTVRPGSPVLADVNDWRNVITFPDIHSWAWKESIDINTSYLADSGRLVNTVICTGWFERLISFMDFAEAAKTLIDKKRRQSLVALFEALTDLYIEIINKFMESFPGLIHGITVHDDWGNQNGPSIGEKTIRETLFSPIKRITDYLHSKGLYADMHNCGKIDRLLPILVDLGIDRLENQPLVNRDDFYRNYGRVMSMSYTPDALPPDATDEDYRKAAREFVDKYFNKGTKVLLETYYQPMPMPYLEELYICSRLKSNTF